MNRRTDRERYFWLSNLENLGYQVTPPYEDHKDLQLPFQTITPPNNKQCEFRLVGSTGPKLFLRRPSIDQPELVILQVHDNVKKHMNPPHPKETQKLSELRQALEDAGLPIYPEVATFPK